MNTLIKLRKHYQTHGFITYSAVHGEDTILIFFKNVQKAKIFGIEFTTAGERFDLGCFHTYDSKIILLNHDVSYDNYNVIIDKIKEIDESTTEEINTFYDNPYLCPHIIFENPQEVVMTYLKENGYQIMTV